MSNNLFYARKYLYNPTFSCFLFYESNFYVTKLFNQPIGAKMFDCHAAPRLKKKKIGACQKFYILFSLEQTPPPSTPYNLQQMFHDPSLSQSRFLFRFLHPNLKHSTKCSLCMCYQPMDAYTFYCWTSTLS